MEKVKKRTFGNKINIAMAAITTQIQQETHNLPLQL